MCPFFVSVLIRKEERGTFSWDVSSCLFLTFFISLNCSCWWKVFFHSAFLMSFSFEIRPLFSIFSSADGWKKASLFSFKSSTYTRGRVTTTWNFAAVIWPASYVKFYFLFYPIYTTFLSLRLGGRFEHCQADLLMSSAEKCGPTHDRKEKERRPGCWRVLSFVCHLRHHFACPPPWLCWSDWGQQNEVGRWAKLFFLAGFDRNTDSLQKKKFTKNKHEMPFHGCLTVSVWLIYDQTIYFCQISCKDFE